MSEQTSTGPSPSQASEGSRRSSMESSTGSLDKTLVPVAEGYRNVAWELKPLDRGEMLQLLAQGKYDEWKDKVIGRCNYWLFDCDIVRGTNYKNAGRWLSLLSRARAIAADSQEDYTKPNDSLKNPPEEFLEKFVGGYKPGSRAGKDYLGKEDAVDIQEKITKALRSWGTHEKEQELLKAIDAIPNPHLIKKVVCFGLGPIRTESPKIPGLPSPNWEYEDQRNVNRHAAAVMIVHQLQKRTNQAIDLYVGGPSSLRYGEPHKEAFQTWSWPSEPADIRFMLTDSTYNKHETFTKVDDNSFVLDTDIHWGLVDIIYSEYARPVAIICEAIREGVDGEAFDTCQDTCWYEVEHENKIQPLPGMCRPRAFLPARIHRILGSEYKIVPEFEYVKTSTPQHAPYWDQCLMYSRKD